MADEPGTLEQIAQELGLALAPLEVLLSPENLPTLLLELGLDSPPALNGDVAFVQKLVDAANKAVAIAPQLEIISQAAESGDDQQLITAVAQLLIIVGELASALDALANDFKRAAAGSMDAGSLAAFVEEMVSRIFENVLLRYLDSNHPVLWQFLALLTLVEYKSHDTAPDGSGVTLLRRRLHFDRIGTLFSNPLDLLKTAYGWGTEQFDGKALFFQLSDTLETLQALADYQEVTDDETPVLDLFNLTFGPTKTSHPPGIQAELFVDLSESTDLTLSQISDDWRIALQISAGLTAGLILRLLPPAKLEFDADATVAGSIALSLIGQDPDQNTPF